VRMTGDVCVMYEFTYCVRDIYCVVVVVVYTCFCVIVCATYLWGGVLLKREDDG